MRHKWSIHNKLFCIEFSFFIDRLKINPGRLYNSRWCLVLIFLFSSIFFKHINRSGCNWSKWGMIMYFFQWFQLTTIWILTRKEFGMRFCCSILQLAFSSYTIDLFEGRIIRLLTKLNFTSSLAYRCLQHSWIFEFSTTFMKTSKQLWNVYSTNKRSDTNLLIIENMSIFHKKEDLF